MKNVDNPTQVDDNTKKILKNTIDDLAKLGVSIDYSENFDETIGKIIHSYCKIAGEEQFNKRINELPEKINNHHSWKNEFEKRLNERWEKPFDLLDFFILQSIEVGQSFNKENRPIAAKNKDFVFECLIRLQGRACLVAQEVLTLMKSGYADGANARWRTLNEIAVICIFIKEHGNDVAERYLLHQYIESCKSIREYQKYVKRLGYVDISEEEIQRNKEIYSKLIKRFKKEFKESNGWAAHALNNPNPKFHDIVEKAHLDHLLPFYRMASHSVHPTFRRTPLQNNNF